MKKRKLYILGIIILIAVLAVIFFNLDKSSTGNVSQNFKVVPLSEAERQQVSQAVLSTNFIYDIPEKYPVAITFFSFNNGERILHDSFLVGNKGFLSEGEPEVYVGLHSKYISELGQGDLCSVIQKANKAGDISFYSESSTASLLIKYAGLLKHRGCLGL